jgi:acetyl-CoA synthetase
VIDAGLQPVADGSTGEIAIRGPNVMRGYYKNEAATADAFTPDGWLRTGDLGHRDADGYFWYQSRADDVITSAGYRIGPGEIEDALNGHPAVAMSAVVGVPDPVTTESIRAYVVLRAGHVGDDALAEAIRDAVRQRLARHECPRRIEFVDALPMTATGKIMRRELRKRASGQG